MTQSSSRSIARKRFRAERDPSHDDSAPSAPAAFAVPSPDSGGTADRGQADGAVPDSTRPGPTGPGPTRPAATGDEIDAIRAELGAMHAMMGRILRATTGEDTNPEMSSGRADSGRADLGGDSEVAVRIEIARMVKMIGKAKAEIAHIKHPGADNNRMEDARSELDAIIHDTATATDEILGQAEAQMDLLTRLAGTIAGDTEAEALCARIEAATIKIMEACNFQDLTGQRTSKVIATLRHIEERIVAMIGIWGIEAFEDLPIPETERDEDAALLNGPARAGEGISQADIDALFD